MARKACTDGFSEFIFPAAEVVFTFAAGCGADFFAAAAAGLTGCLLLFVAMQHKYTRLRQDCKKKSYRFTIAPVSVYKDPLLLHQFLEQQPVTTVVKQGYHINAGWQCMYIHIFCSGLLHKYLPGNITDNGTDIYR